RPGDSVPLAPVLLGAAAQPGGRTDPGRRRKRLARLQDRGSASRTLLGRAPGPPRRLGDRWRQSRPDVVRVQRNRGAWRPSFLSSLVRLESSSGVPKGRDANGACIDQARADFLPNRFRRAPRASTTAASAPGRRNDKAIKAWAGEHEIGYWRKPGILYVLEY